MIVTFASTVTKFKMPSQPPCAMSYSQETSFHNKSAIATDRKKSLTQLNGALLSRRKFSDQNKLQWELKISPSCFIPSAISIPLQHIYGAHLIYKTPLKIRYCISRRKKTNCIWQTLIKLLSMFLQGSEKLPDNGSSKNINRANVEQTDKGRE